MKINSIALNNFRGFPNKEMIRLNGNNLLVYGENGAGKSSIFTAFHDLFSADCPSIDKHKNQFSKREKIQIEVEFDDALPAVIWHNGGEHPGSALQDIRVANAALRVACIDYRSVLRTNFIFGNNPLNWFHVLHHELLSGFQDTSGRTIYKVWTDLSHLVERAEHSSLTRELSAGITENCQLFTNLFREAIVRLRIKLPPLLEKLSGNTLQIELPEYEGLTYNASASKRDRKLVGDEYTPQITFLDLPALERPQTFLNEARLSALALATYLAGRLAVIPENQSDVLRLLVLDDVLIGLDHSNRLPLLHMLTETFSDWQIVLLTHDRVWFDMAQFEIKETGNWNCIEIYDSEQPLMDENGIIQKYIPAPLVHDVQDLNLPATLLKKAGTFLQEGYLPAAANYTRSAFEAHLKIFCHQKNVPVPYNIEHHKVGSGILISAIRAFMKDNGRLEEVSNDIDRVMLFNKIVMNRYSHSLPLTLTRTEVEGAIQAVFALKSLYEVIADKNPSRITRVIDTLQHPAPTRKELEYALVDLKSLFQSKLDDYCENKQVPVKYNPRGGASKQHLWKGIKDTSVKHSETVSQLLTDKVKVALIEKWLMSRNVNVAELNKIILQELAEAILRNEKTVFDT